MPLSNNLSPFSTAASHHFYASTNPILMLSEPNYSSANFQPKMNKVSIFAPEFLHYDKKSYLKEERVKLTSFKAVFYALFLY